MPPTLKVFHINTERTFRGGEVQTVLLARELERRGHRNVVFAQPDSPLAKRARKDGLAVAEIPMRGEWDALAALRLRAAIRRMTPDVLHAHTSHAGALALMARWPRRRPAVVLSRRVGFPVHDNFLSRKKYASADAVLAISHAVRDGLLDHGLDEARVHVAESCTDFAALKPSRSRAETRRELGIPENAFVVGNAAHFDRHKGQVALIEAFCDFAAMRHDKLPYLLLAGEGPEMRACRRAAAQRNLIDRVVFAGRRTDMADMYAAMDMFFLSTLTLLEGWSNALTEAMAMGLPCAAARSAVTMERVRDGENGLLVAPRRREEWVKAIDRLCMDDTLRARLAEAGKKEALRYTPDYLAEKTLACYGAAMKRF